MPLRPRTPNRSIQVSTMMEAEGLARGRLESVTDDLIVLSIPGTSYQLHLVPTVSAADIRTSIGKRITGRIEANALRMHVAAGGGQFIEPVWGMPRIVAGSVLAMNEESKRVLVDVAVPIWVTPAPEQDLSMLQPGELVNFYVESGSTFTPVSDGRLRG